MLLEVFSGRRPQTLPLRDGPLVAVLRDGTRAAREEQGVESLSQRCPDLRQQLPEIDPRILLQVGRLGGHHFIRKNIHDGRNVGFERGRQIRSHQFDPGILQFLQSMRRDPLELLVEAAPSDAGHAEPHLLQRSRRHRRRMRPQHGVEQDQILDAARHRPQAVEQRRDRHDAAAGHSGRWSGASQRYRIARRVRGSSRWCLRPPPAASCAHSPQSPNRRCCRPDCGSGRTDCGMDQRSCCCW